MAITIPRNLRRSLYRTVFLFSVVLLIFTNNRKNSYSDSSDYDIRKHIKPTFEQNVHSRLIENRKKMNLTTLEADEIYASMGEWDKVKDKKALMAELERLEKKSMEYLKRDMAVMNKQKLATEWCVKARQNDIWWF